ncbi:MAG TPA: glycoside hydrolase family 25 protein [Longimicrobiaceae bacterium]|jgi:lysozyme|nr:glycoside hydrolase family 25 protein [Longimicrobiaceae bacterium]
MIDFHFKLASALLIPAVFASTPGHSRKAKPVAGAPAIASARPALPARALAPAVAAVPVKYAAKEVRLGTRGIDVSHYQGRIDWQAAADDGVGFAFVKATEGGRFVDPAFARNWAGLREVGIARGAYHRFRPRLSGIAQADHFLRVVDVTEGDLPPVVDVESVEGVGDARLVAGVRAWLGEVERRTGVRPIVYTKPGFRRAHLGTALDDYPLWVAEYDVDEPSVGRWAFWQHSERGSVAGIGRAVDLNRFNGSVDDLRQLAISPAPAEGVRPEELAVR